MAAQNKPTKITETERKTVAGSELTQKLGINADEIAWRKEYTGFTDEDASRLVAISDIFEAIVDELVEEF